MTDDDSVSIDDRLSVPVWTWREIDADMVPESTASEIVLDKDIVRGELKDPLAVAAWVWLGENVGDGVGGGVIVNVTVSDTDAVVDCDSSSDRELDSVLLGDGELDKERKIEVE